MIRVIALTIVLGLAFAGIGDDVPALDAATASKLGITPEAGGSGWTAGTYSYDGSGNITAIGTETKFLYDAHGRLVEATVGRGTGSTEHREYQYDPYGNRTATMVGGSTIPTATAVGTNHLTGLSASYDAAGNLTQLQPPGQSTRYEYKYDALGVLQEVKAANIIGTPTQLHIYTADDERLWTFDMAAGSSHWKIRDLGGKVLRDYQVTNTTWSIARDYIYRDGQLLAAVTPTGTLHFSLDHLGTPRVISDSNRNRVGFHHYLPFGEEWTDQSGAQEGEPMKFTGHERDADGLDYMHARYYSANLGRFLSVDPVLDVEKNLTEPQRWNRYSYVTNNPLRYTDPDGRDKLAAWLLGPQYADVSTFDAIFSRDTISDIDQGRQTWAEEHQRITRGFSPVPTTKTQLAMAVLLPGFGKYAGGALASVTDDVVGIGYRSFSSLKRAIGSAGQGQQWHHIVEQTAGNVGRFGERAIHNTSNVVKVSVETHRKISAYYSSKQAFTGGLTVRQWLSKKSIKEQYEFGMQTLQRLSQ